MTNKEKNKKLGMFVRDLLKDYDCERLEDLERDKLKEVARGFREEGLPVPSKILELTRFGKG